MHLHMLSDLSKGLFDKAIAQSGTALATFTNLSKASRTSSLASSMGWNGIGGEDAIYEFLKNADASDIVKHQNKIVTDDDKRRGLFAAFTPCVEAYRSEQTFLTKSPIELIDNAWGNGVPLIIGATSEEGLLYYFGVKADPNSYLNDDSFEKLLPPELNLTNDSVESREMVKRMKKLYYDGDELEPIPSVTNIMRFLDILSDKYFLHGMHLAVKSRTKDTQSAATYLYRFNFQSDFNALRKMFGFNDIIGSLNIITFHLLHSIRS